MGPVQPAQAGSDLVALMPVHSVCHAFHHVTMVGQTIGSNDHVAVQQYGVRRVECVTGLEQVDWQ